MGKLVLECFDKKIKLRKIAKAVYKTLGQKDKLRAEVVFSAGEDMRTLNAQTRGVDSITDVLSYPMINAPVDTVLYRKDYPLENDGGYLFLGSIVLCDDRINEQAEELGHSLERERTYLIVHGLMHLFGYDHMEENEKRHMRAREKSVLAALGIEEE